MARPPKPKDQSKRFRQKQLTLREENELMRKVLQDVWAWVEDAQTLMNDGCYLTAREQLDEALGTIEKLIPIELKP